ncbi:hypothetical protein BKA81DRAFT_365982 [Phyllosticta paracitricarpa]
MSLTLAAQATVWLVSSNCLLTFCQNACVAMKLPGLSQLLFKVKYYARGNRGLAGISLPVVRRRRRRRQPTGRRHPSSC